MQNLLKTFAFLAAATLLVGQQPKPDVWSPLRFLVGSWKGDASGQPGTGKSERIYEFVLGGKFLQVRHKTVYPPQAKNPKGEVHEDLGMLSYDKARKRFVLRQFHIEGFVNQYVAESELLGSPFTFSSEAIENIPPGWKARESYRIVSPDEFIEVFELAEPGKPFEVYSEQRFRRVGGV